MRKGLTVLFLILLIETVPVSCSFFCRDSCGCDPSPLPQKQIDIISWNIETVSENYQPLDTSFVYDFDKVYKSLRIDKRLIVSFEDKSVVGFSNVAYACSPMPPRAIQTIESIKIVATHQTAFKDANDIIQVGDNISNRFKMTYYFDANFQPIETFIYQRLIYDEDKYTLKLIERPFQEVKMKFNIVITLSDGKVLELNDQRLRVK